MIFPAFSQLSTCPHGRPKPRSASWRPPHGAATAAAWWAAASARARCSEGSRSAGTPGVLAFFGDAIASSNSPWHNHEWDVPSGYD